MNKVLVTISHGKVVVVPVCLDEVIQDFVMQWRNRTREHEINPIENTRKETRRYPGSGVYAVAKPRMKPEAEARMSVT